MGLGRDVVYGVGAALTSPVWGVNLLRTGKWRTDWAGKFGTPGNNIRDKGTRRRMLLHAVSVGEVNLIRGLVEELARDGEVVVSVTTNTGHARAVQLYHPRHAVVRFPLDFSFAVRRFLDAVKPDLVALAELEVWPNFVEACEARGIPVCVVNGRLSERSHRGYMRFRRWLEPSFRGLTKVAAQSEAIAERFVDVGVPNERVVVLDTMKWDAAKIEPPEAVTGAAELASELRIDHNRPVIVAGSTAPGEDELLIRTKPAGVQLVIAPRKPEWFEGVMKVCPGAARRSACKQGQSLSSNGTDVFLLDTIGELRKAYALADVAIVGRSFTGKLYGSDMMEPIGLGVPTIIGPYYRDFASVMDALISGGGIVVSDEPMSKATMLLKHRDVAGELAASGCAVIRSRQGSTQKHAAMVRGLLGLKEEPDASAKRQASASA